MNMAVVYYSFLLFGAIIAFLVFIKKTKNKLLFFAGTVFMANTLWMLPKYFFERAAMSNSILRCLNSLAYSIYNSVQIFGLGGDMKEIRLLNRYLVGNTNKTFAFFVAFVAVLLHFIAPIVTVSAIISLFKDYFARLRYNLNKISSKEILIFSELNERSIVLASDIINSKRNERDSSEEQTLIVFCDVFSQNSESSYELQNRASELSAICLKKDIASIKWIPNNKKWIKNKTFKLFLIGNNENENLEQTIKLINLYDLKAEKDTITLYLFSKSSTSELSIQSTLKKNSTVHVIRVDYKRSMIYNYLYNHGRDIIEHVSSKEKKVFKILILGTGEHGFEMIKSLLWFCQRTGYSLKINAFDTKDDIEKRFYAHCPGIKEYNKKNELICFEQVDFNCCEFFYDYLIGNPEKGKNGNMDADFVFISLGDDSNNIALARKVREVFARSYIDQNDTGSIMAKPIITTVVENSQVKEALDGNKYQIEVIGDFKSVYSTNVIINSKLEKIALFVHSDGKEDITTYDKMAFYQEYNYRSTIAQVIYHLAWKESGCESDTWRRFREEIQSSAPEKLGGILKTLNDLKQNTGRDFSSKELEELFGLFDQKIKIYIDCFSDEKDRWNLYEFTEGFERYTGTNQDKELLKELHRHPLIKPFSELSKGDKNKKDTDKPKLTERQLEAKYFSEAYQKIAAEHQ